MTMRLSAGGYFYRAAALAIIAFLCVGSESRAAPRDQDAYISAKKEYDRLSKTKITSEKRLQWEKLAERFERFPQDFPRSAYADAALLSAGKLYQELHKLDGKERMLELAINCWRSLFVKYPQSPLAEESLYRMALGYEEGKRDPAEARKQYQALIEKYPQGDFAARAQERLDGISRKGEEEKKQQARPANGSGGKALLSQIRHTSSQSYTRVTMELSASTRYEAHVLSEDASKGLPPRIYVDLLGARLAMGQTQPIPVQDGLLRQVRVGQFKPDVVRVVLDMSSLTEYKTFLLPDPYRLIIDIQGKQSNKTPPSPVQLSAPSKPEPIVTPKEIETKGATRPSDSAPSPRQVEEKVPRPEVNRGAEKLVSLPKGKEPVPPAEKKLPAEKRMPAPALRKIVLDPGHGGKDPGAVGVGGIAEKDVVLAVAKKLGEKLKRMGIAVVLTRQDDSFIPLEDRTAIANVEEADLFISLHVNASPSPEAKGLETYYLDNTTDEASIRMAARENATSRKNISDLQFILSDLTQNSKLEDSITLAHRLHGSIVSQMGERYGEVKDLGVKKALFYVLVGARMPSVLVELFFVTNKIEGRSMSKKAYQDAVAESLYDGIKKYFESNAVVKNL